MAIDTSGQWWVGTEADDIREYLTDFEAEGYPVHETRIAGCECGSVEFAFEADQEEGCARRICTACGEEHLICDSGEYWDEAEPKSFQCIECGGTSCNVGAGFSLYDPDDGKDRDVRWISIGLRCTNCGTLGCFVDWKVGYSPSYQLLGQV